MITQQMNNIQNTIRNFNYLQGLRVVPFGLFILFDVTVLSVWEWYVRWRPYSQLGFMMVALLFAILIHKFYISQFGIVRNLPARQNVHWIVLNTILITSIVLMPIAGGLDRHIGFSVSLMGLALTGVLGSSYFLLKRWYIAFLAVMVFLFSVLPLTGIYSSQMVFGPEGNIGTIVVGFGLLFGGIVDHMILIRSMRAISQNNEPV
jgi:hypothetical protein